MQACAWTAVCACVYVQVVQAVQPAAMPGLREAYSQALNIVIRKQLRLYASDLRKAVAVHTASNPAEPNMGLAHKRVSLDSLGMSLDFMNRVCLSKDAKLIKSLPCVIMHNILL